MTKVGMVSPGCPKQMDAELMLAKLKKAGFERLPIAACRSGYHRTCGFIEDTKRID